MAKIKQNSDQLDNVISFHDDVEFRVLLDHLLQHRLLVTLH